MTDGSPEAVQSQGDRAEPPQSPSVTGICTECTESSQHEHGVTTVDGVSEELLGATYVVSKHARKFADRAHQSYNNGEKTTAAAYSAKKQALYTLKRDILVKIAPHAETIKIHEIDGREYYLLQFEEYGFHTPCDEVFESFTVEGRDQLPNFTKTAVKERCTWSLHNALQFIEEHVGLNANAYLQSFHDNKSTAEYYTGWSFLPYSMNNKW